MPTKAAGLVVVALALAGCAGYSIQPDGSGTGYDVYAPEPYLKGTPVAVDAGGQKALVYSFEVVWLPNYSKRYRVRSWSGLGKADFAFTFTDGWRLTSVSDKADNSGVLEQVVGLAQHLLPANPFALPSGEKAVVPLQGPAEALREPVLYRIEFDDAGRPSCLRKVSVTEGPPCAPPGVHPCAPPVAPPCGTR